MMTDNKITPRTDVVTLEDIKKRQCKRHQQDTNERAGRVCHQMVAILWMTMIIGAMVSLLTELW